MVTIDSNPPRLQRLHDACDHHAARLLVARIEALGADAFTSGQRAQLALMRIRLAYAAADWRTVEDGCLNLMFEDTYRPESVLMKPVLELLLAEAMWAQDHRGEAAVVLRRTRPPEDNEIGGSISPDLAVDIWRAKGRALAIRRSPREAAEAAIRALQLALNAPGTFPDLLGRLQLEALRCCCE